MRVIVVGAGIGGLTVTLALLREGFDVIVLEQASELSEVGAGIQISSNGTTVLRELGLIDQLSSIAVRPQAMDFYELETGNQIYRSPLGSAAKERYGGDFFQVHRADLIDILARVVPKELVRLNARVTSVAQMNSEAIVTLDTGEQLRADCVIGADGIHSEIRRYIHGEENVEFDRKMMWRALVPGDRIASLNLEESCHIWCGPGRTVVAYWVRPGELFNFIGCVPSDEVQSESYSITGDLAELQHSFVGSEPRVAGIIEALDETFITGLYYRKPILNWSSERVTLMGDAAHAMTPYLAQGACASMEGAWILAKCLAKRSSNEVSLALKEYQQRRIPRTTKIQSAARAMVKQLHETDAREIKARNGRLLGMSKIDPLSETVWAWLYDYNPIKEVDTPIDKVTDYTNTFCGKRMDREESQQAFDMWKSAFSPEDLALGIQGLRSAYDRFMQTEFPPDKDTIVSEVDEGPVKGCWVTSSNRELPRDRIVLHVHGGGYVMGCAKSSLNLAERISGTIDARCFAVEYRLAPENPYPAALEDVLAAYQWLLDQGISPEQIIMCGESSGGGLAIAAVLSLVASATPLPAAVVAMSPMTDLTIQGPSIAEFAGQDPVVNRDNLTLFAGSYFQANDPTDPLISPVQADFTGFPPLLIQAARGEALESDSTRLAAKAKANGVDVTLQLFADSVHILQIFPFLPEAKQALADVATFANKHASMT